MISPNERFFDRPERPLTVHVGFGLVGPMRSLVLAIIVSMSLVAPLGAAPNEGAALAVRVSRLEMTAPGRIAISIEISGFEPNLHPTIESAIRIGGQVIEGPQQMAVATSFAWRTVTTIATGVFRSNGGTGVK